MIQYLTIPQSTKTPFFNKNKLCRNIFVKEADPSFKLQPAGIDFALRMSSEKKGRKGTEMIMKN